MSKGLFDMPTTTAEVMEPQQAVNTVSFETKQQIYDKVQEQKQAVLQELKDGIAPENVLFVAIGIIKLLDGDTEYYDKVVEILESKYNNTAQQSLLLASVAEKAQEQRQALTDYNESVRKKVKTMLSGYTRVSRQLNELMQTIDTMDNKILDWDGNVIELDEANHD